MFIESDYYPETNDSTELDKGYEWTPGINSGTYIWKEWVWSTSGAREWCPADPDYVPVDPYDFDYCRAFGCWSYSAMPDKVRVVSTETRTAFSGGPFLPDPYEPTEPIIIPIPIVTFTQLTVYVNGISATVLESNLDLMDIIHGIDAPLIIGPI